MFRQSISILTGAGRRRLPHPWFQYSNVHQIQAKIKGICLKFLWAAPADMPVLHGSLQHMFRAVAAERASAIHTQREWH